jgi:hypothetical protein
VSRALVLAAAVVLSGCSSTGAAPATDRVSIDYARHPAEQQDAALEAFVKAASSPAPRTLVLVDTTIDGQEIQYTLGPSPGAKGECTMTIGVDGLGDAKLHRVYVAPNARVVLARASRDPTPLVPGAGAGRPAETAVTVLVSGQVIFDSAKSSPVRPAAAKFLAP